MKIVKKLFQAVCLAALFLSAGFLIYHMVYLPMENKKLVAELKGNFPEPEAPGASGSEKKDQPAGRKCPVATVDLVTLRKQYLDVQGWLTIPDTGLTGRKLMVDTYGSLVPHGGGAFSGKDCSKVDRSGAYMARYIAKNMVAAGLASRCQVSLAYAIGVAQPVMVQVDTFGTGKICADDCLAAAIPLVFGLTPSQICDTLHLKRPIYRQSAVFGHFGRKEFPWEKTDKAEQLRDTVM